MAIQKTVTLANDVVLTDAYHRIESIHYSNSESATKIRLEIFKDASASAAAKPAVDAVDIAVIDASFETYFGITVLDEVNKNVVKQAYEYIKTLTDVNGWDYTTGTSDV